MKNESTGHQDASQRSHSSFRLGANDLTAGDGFVVPLLRALNWKTGEMDMELMGRGVAILCQQGLIMLPRLQFFRGDDLLGEYFFVPVRQGTEDEDEGNLPSPDELPPGTRLRIVAGLNPELGPDGQAAVSRLLDWPPAPPLQRGPKVEYRSLRFPIRRPLPPGCQPY